MAKPGRKPKPGPREPNGRPQRTYERVAPTPELEAKKREALGDLAPHAEAEDLCAVWCSRGSITLDMWRAASRYRGLYIRAYGRLDEKPGPLARMLPDADRGYKTDAEAEGAYCYLRNYVARWGSRAAECSLYLLAVARREPSRVGPAIQALKLLIEGENELAKRRERGQSSEMQAAELGLGGAAA